MYSRHIKAITILISAENLWNRGTSITTGTFMATQLKMLIGRKLQNTSKESKLLKVRTCFRPDNKFLSQFNKSNDLSFSILYLFQVVRKWIEIERVL